MNKEGLILIVIAAFALFGNKMKIKELTQGNKVENALFDILNSEQGKNLLHSEQFIRLAKTVEFAEFLDLLNDEQMNQLNTIM